MEVKQKIDRLRDKIQPLIIPAIVLSIIMTGTLLWKVQQDNVDSLQSKIEHLKKEIAQPSSTKEKLKLEERLKLEKDILVIEKDKTTIQNGVYTTLVQALGGVILSVTAYVGYRNFKIGEENLKIGQKNLKVTEDKQVTERFSKSIEHLGSDKIDVRIGGIYALEQIAIDSPEKYHWTIVEILSAFIREKRPLDSTELVGIDIQAALNVLGRRKVEQDPKGKYINLRKVNLIGVEIQSANLNHVDLSGANLNGTNLKDAILKYANFRETDLSDANLRGSDLNNANLKGSNLNNADLHGAYLCWTDLSGANLSQVNLVDVTFQANDFNGATLNGAIFDDAIMNAAYPHVIFNVVDLSTAINLTQEQLVLAKTYENAKLPDYLNPPPPN
jgi:Pentapeptide repeats (8 copies)